MQADSINLDKYRHRTSTPWAIFIALISPVRCLAVITLIECAPMASPEAGSGANALFWGRDCLAIGLMTRAIVEQFRGSVPGLKLTTFQTIAMSIISSGGATAFMVLMAGIIGFPLPFALVVGIPVWLVLYGFVHVGTLGQNFYLGLLTPIKLIAKNWMSYFLGKNYDLMPQIMIFNVDVFNALYVSSSMQNSKSINTTLLMVALDAVLAWISLTDVRDLMRDVILLQYKVPATHAKLRNPPVSLKLHYKLSRRMIRYELA
ncbi:unnamed protein product [Phytophthora lilii]|uniref:Unnamed protein product n=1 Tax=Phytophthora lilii TaxID=2077276 RepID=A0A9W6TRL7_9STRA|nr:unnamed protein product [Phytophthora lilii]